MRSKQSEDSGTCAWGTELKRLTYVITKETFQRTSLLPVFKSSSAVKTFDETRLADTDHKCTSDLWEADPFPSTVKYFKKDENKVRRYARIIKSLMV